MGGTVLRGGTEPGAASRDWGKEGRRGQQVHRVTRQQNGEVGFVLLLARPGCSKPYLSFKGRFALKMPRAGCGAEGAGVSWQGVGRGQAE